MVDRVGMEETADALLPSFNGDAVGLSVGSSGDLVGTALAGAVLEMGDDVGTKVIGAAAVGVSEKVGGRMTVDVGIADGVSVGAHDGLSSSSTVPLPQLGACVVTNTVDVADVCDNVEVSLIPLPFPKSTVPTTDASVGGAVCACRVQCDGGTSESQPDSDAFGVIHRAINTNMVEDSLVR